MRRWRRSVFTFGSVGKVGTVRVSVNFLCENRNYSKILAYMCACAYMHKYARRVNSWRHTKSFLRCVGERYYCIFKRERKLASDEKDRDNCGATFIYTLTSPAQQFYALIIVTLVIERSVDRSISHLRVTFVITWCFSLAHIWMNLYARECTFRSNDHWRIRTTSQINRPMRYDMAEQDYVFVKWNFRVRACVLGLTRYRMLVDPGGTL